MTEERKLTKGEELVGLTFNPSNDVRVDKIKMLMAEVIDELLLLKPFSNESAMLIDQAIIKTIDAQMWSVKAVTYK